MSEQMTRDELEHGPLSWFMQQLRGAESRRDGMNVSDDFVRRLLPLFEQAFTLARQGLELSKPTQLKRLAGKFGFKNYIELEEQLSILTAELEALRRVVSMCRDQIEKEERCVFRLNNPFGPEYKALRTAIGAAMKKETK